MPINIIKFLIVTKKAMAAPFFEYSEGADPVMDPNYLLKFIENAQNIVSILAGAIAIGMLIWGGFIYITAGGNEEKNQKAKTVLTYAIVGIVIILLAKVLITLFIKALGGDVI